jgi:hypothetical protein
MAITKRWVQRWSALYPTGYDTPIESLAGKRRPTYLDVEAVLRWKSARSLGYFMRNDPAEVVTAVREALATKDAAAALDRLTSLKGVGERVGSAILAAFRPDLYTVMDQRAWKSLTAHGLLTELTGRSWRQSWMPYLAECRRLVARLNVDSLRTLDRALYKAQGDVSIPS